MTLFPVSCMRKTRKCKTRVQIFIYGFMVLTSVLIIVKLIRAMVSKDNYSIDMFPTRVTKSASPSCAGNGSSLFLFISVPSSVANFRQRSAIRNAWGSVATVNPSLKVVFFVGTSEERKLKQIIAKEKQIFQDIVEIDVKEKYENLAKKSIGILKWIYMNCNSAMYFLKVDDDIFLNIGKLVDDLKRMGPRNSIIGCKVMNTSPFRFPLSKWYISRKQYSGDTFPDYISGPAYVITGDIFSKLYFATKTVPNIFLEDVYINGLCREHINGVAVGHPGFSCGYRDQGPCGTNFRYKITGHHYYPKEIERMWDELNDKWHTCPLSQTYWFSKVVDVFNSFL